MAYHILEERIARNEAAILEIKTINLLYGDRPPDYHPISVDRFVSLAKELKIENMLCDGPPNDENFTFWKLNETFSGRGVTEAEKEAFQTLKKEFLDAGWDSSGHVLRNIQYQCTILSHGILPAFILSLLD